VSAIDFLDELWRQQSLWSRTANGMKARIERARAGALAVTVAVAVLATLAGVLAAGQPVMGRVLAGVAAFGPAVLPVLRPGWSGRALRDWTRARSVSEALKSEVHLWWLARVGDYRDDQHGAKLRCSRPRSRRCAGSACAAIGAITAAALDLLRHQHGRTT
jgi:hypothetical protein